MTFLAPIVAQAGATTLSRVLPWAIASVVILSLGVGLYVEHNRATTAEAALKTMTADRDLQRASAAGWQAASAQRDGVINDQAAELTRMATDKRHAQQLADQQVAADAAKLTDLQSQLASLKARANAHPDQTRALGPIVNDVLDSLCGKAGAADPTAACN